MQVRFCSNKLGIYSLLLDDLTNMKSCTLLLVLCLVSVALAFNGAISRTRLGLGRSLSHLNMVAKTEDGQAYKVQSNEGLLDTNRMQRAFEGTGIKVPAEKQLHVG